MKKKAHDNYDVNFLQLKSDNPFVENASVHVIGDKVFIETENESICLTKDQAKQLSNYLHNMVVRPVHDMFGREFDDHE